MLREDGMVMDDGTTARFDLNHFVMTTTTANAVSVFRHLEFCRQCLYPNLDVHLISATEQWAQFAVAGPNSRKLLEKIIDKEYDISNLNFPYMGCKKITIAIIFQPDYLEFLSRVNWPMRLQFLHGMVILCLKS